MYLCNLYNSYNLTINVWRPSYKKWQDKRKVARRRRESTENTGGISNTSDKVIECSCSNRIQFYTVEYSTCVR